MSYDYISTKYDIMHEFLVQGCEVEGSESFPVLKPSLTIPENTIDFEGSKYRSLKNRENLNVNFYIDDKLFSSVWTDPKKYLSHFKKFHSICGFDFSIDLNSMKPLQYYNKWRNMALTYFYQSHGIDVIPSVNILPEECWDWCFKGLPEESVLSCSSNGRVRSRALRKEFCESFYGMEKILKPKAVVIVGREVPELETDTRVVYLPSRSQRIEMELKQNGNLYKNE